MYIGAAFVYSTPHPIRRIIPCPFVPFIPLLGTRIISL
jgi:hypothetical protein